MTTGSLCGPSCGAPLYVHVLGSLVLFGGVLAVTVLAFAAQSQPLQRAIVLHRIAFWTTLGLVVPAFVAMRLGGQWVLDHEGLDRNEPGWVGTGFAISDAGVIVIVLLGLLGWLSARRPRLGVVVGAIGAIYLLALGVAWFAMSARPDW